MKFPANFLHNLRKTVIKQGELITLFYFNLQKLLLLII